MLARVRTQRGSNARHHKIEVIGVDENVVEIPVHWIRQGYCQLLRDICDGNASSVAYLCCVLNDFLETQAIWSYCIHFCVFGRMQAFDDEISHILNMHKVEDVIAVARQGKNRESLDQVCYVVEHDAFPCSSAEDRARLDDSPLQAGVFYMLLYFRLLSDVIIGRVQGCLSMGSVNDLLHSCLFGAIHQHLRVLSNLLTSQAKFIVKSDPISLNERLTSSQGVNQMCSIELQWFVGDPIRRNAPIPSVVGKIDHTCSLGQQLLSYISARVGLGSSDGDSHNQILYYAIYLQGQTIKLSGMVGPQPLNLLRDILEWLCFDDIQDPVIIILQPCCPFHYQMENIEKRITIIIFHAVQQIIHKLSLVLQSGQGSVQLYIESLANLKMFSAKHFIEEVLHYFRAGFVFFDQSPYLCQGFLHSFVTTVQEKSDFEVDDFVFDALLIFKGNDVLSLHVHMVDLMFDKFSQCSANLQEVIKHILFIILKQVAVDIKRILLVVRM